MTTRGIVIRGANQELAEMARRKRVAVSVSDEYNLPYSVTLFLDNVEPDWSLVARGFEQMEHWDVAAPFYRYNLLASELGGVEERRHTEAVCLDLRLLVYEPRLLFVRDTEGGRALLATWREECVPGFDERLAFLRALHRVKPIFCTLPCNWLIRDLKERPIAKPINRSTRLQIRTSLHTPPAVITMRNGRVVMEAQDDVDRD